MVVFCGVAYRRIKGERLRTTGRYRRRGRGRGGGVGAPRPGPARRGGRRRRTGPGILTSGYPGKNLRGDTLQRVSRAVVFAAGLW